MKSLMKTLFMLLTLSMLMTISSCSDDDDNGTNPTISNNSLSCTVSGLVNYNYSADNTFHSEIGEGETITGSIINNQDMTGSSILLNFVNLELGEQTITLPHDDVTVTGFLTNNNTSSLENIYDKSGTITLTENTADKMKGTFEITCITLTGEEIILSNGKFECKKGTIVQ